MAEETNTGEDVNLNSTTANTETPPENQEEQKTTYTVDEVDAMKKEMQSNSDRWVQKILKQQQKYERIIDGVALVSKDPKNLLEINESDPEVAQAILDKYYDGKTIEEYQELYNITVDYSDPKTAKAKIEREANRIATDRMINDKRDEFIAKLKLSDEEIEKFNEAFEERKSLKSFNPKEVVKQLEKAYIEIGDPQNLKKLETQANIANSQATSTSSGNSGGDKKTQFDRDREEASAFLSKFGF